MVFWKGLFPSPKGLRQGDPLPLPFIWLWNSSLEFCRRAFLTILSVKIWVLATYASLMTYSFRATQMTSLFSLCIVLLWSSIGFLVCCLTITMGWIAISLIWMAWKSFSACIFRYGQQWGWGGGQAKSSSSKCRNIRIVSEDANSPKVVPPHKCSNLSLRIVALNYERILFRLTS